MPISKSVARNAVVVISCLVALAQWSSVGWAEPSDASEPPVRPKLAALPDEIPSPSDNPTTPEKVALGKKLFFDPRLSGDNSMSCATCHAPDKGFGDALPRGKGAGGKELSRNSQTVLNVAYLDSLFWDGRAKTLEEQALAPIESPDEMNQDLDELVKELSAIDGYVDQFKDVFDEPVSKAGIAKSLAAFQRTLVTRNSPLDRYLAGDKDALSAKARRGMRLFMGEADCIRCHNGPLLTDGKFYRLGVSFRDRGRAAVTGNDDDLNKFRTPPLRDIAKTGPYMHDGSEKSLFDVVEFYFRRAPNAGPNGLDLDIEPLVGQSYSDIDAIVEFLKALDGELPKIEPPELP